MKIVGDENNPQNNGAGNPGLNVSLKDAEEVVCEKCGSKVFQEKLMIAMKKEGLGKLRKNLSQKDLG